MTEFIAGLPEEDLERIWEAMWIAAEWKDHAERGVPTSSAQPSPTETPSKVPFVPVEEQTPEKVLKPFRKAQLMATKRLQHQIRNKTDDDPGAASQAQAQPSKKPTSSRKPTQKPAKAQKSKKEEKKNAKSKTNTKTKTKSKAKGQGPLQEALALFVKARRAEGLTHREIMAMWKESEERAEIVAQLDPSEVKRRRY